jgi:uncharacterized glyoxalase superfamily protein PhnB
MEGLVIIDFAGIGLLSNDVQRLAQFYRDVLGAEIEESNIHCVVTLGELRFPIYNPHLHEESTPIYRSFGRGSCWLSFEIDDVDVEYERISKLKIDNIVPPHKTPFGQRVMLLKDPDDNIVHLCNR